MIGQVYKGSHDIVIGLVIGDRISERDNEMDTLLELADTACATNKVLTTTTTPTKIIKSRLTLKKYPYPSLIELLLERLKTDPEKGCLVSALLSSTCPLSHQPSSLTDRLLP